MKSRYVYFAEILFSVIWTIQLESLLGTPSVVITVWAYVIYFCIKWIISCLIMHQYLRGMQSMHHYCCTIKWTAIYALLKIFHCIISGSMGSETKKLNTQVSCTFCWWYICWSCSSAYLPYVPWAAFRKVSHFFQTLLKDNQTLWLLVMHFDRCVVLLHADIFFNFCFVLFYTHSIPYSLNFIFCEIKF